MVEWCGEQIEAELGRELFELRLPLPGRERLAVKIVEETVIPQSTAPDPEVVFIRAYGDRVGSICLKLHGVRSNSLRRTH